MTFSKIYPELFPTSPGAQLVAGNWDALPDPIEKNVFFDPSKKTFFSIRSEIVIVFDPVGSKKR